MLSRSLRPLLLILVVQSVVLAERIYTYLCRGYMINTIISKLFQRLIAAHEYFQHVQYR